MERGLGFGILGPAGQSSLIYKIVLCNKNFPKIAKRIHQAPHGEKLMTDKRVFHAPALSVKHQQVTMMNQSIDHGGGHVLVVEDRHPTRKLQVGR